MTLFCEAVTVPPKRSGCDCLGTHFRRNRGVDKHAAMHPPHTSTQFRHSVTRPSHMFDKFDVTVSLAQWGFAFAHNDCTHLARLTSKVNPLLGRMHLFFKRRHRTLHACGYLNGPAAYARSTNLATNGCEEARRHLREKQIIFRPTCLTIASSYVRQLRKSLNLVAPSRVSTPRQSPARRGQWTIGY